MIAFQQSSCLPPPLPPSNFIVLAWQNPADVQNMMQRGKSFQDLWEEADVFNTGRIFTAPYPCFSLLVMRAAGALFSMCGGVCVSLGY